MLYKPLVKVVKSPPYGHAKLEWIRFWISPETRLQRRPHVPVMYLDISMFVFNTHYSAVPTHGSLGVGPLLHRWFALQEQLAQWCNCCLSYHWGLIQNNDTGAVAMNSCRVRCPRYVHSSIAASFRIDSKFNKKFTLSY